ncbi:MAG: aldehyde dehydrogenase EutE [Deltaproteobacteria bacterium]|nr:aldehyde dehydrogenase EutE [Deltaproteobacteria bacterium]
MSRFNPTDFDPAEIDATIRRVKARLGEPMPPVAPTASSPAATFSSGKPGQGEGVFSSVDGAVEAAWEAFHLYREQGSAVRVAVIASIRQSMREQAENLGRMAHEETGLGRAADKRLKNLLVVEKTPGPEELETRTVSGDLGKTWTEYSPYGVIGAITPTTNPTATIINNTISTLSAGNAVVFNVHPNARQVSLENVRLLNRAIVQGGGPANLVTAVAEPTIESAQQLMRHPRVRVLLVTGGPGVVKEALKTDKKAITAGPGNPPVVVDETADLELAGREIVRGASFDNNVICTDEKEIFAVASIADSLLEALGKSGAYLLKEHELKKLERVIFRQLGPPGKPGKIDPRWIGKSPSVILAQIGVQVGEEVRLVVAEVPREHSLVWTEQLMPVLPLVRVRDVDEAIALAVRAEHGFGHTASIYSRNLATITRMSQAMNVSIFVANGPNLAGLGQGGEGHTSFSIASPTGEGLTSPRTFSRIRRVTIAGALQGI